jgi:hypothetical protein
MLENNLYNSDFINPFENQQVLPDLEGNLDFLIDLRFCFRALKHSFKAFKNRYSRR